MSVIRFFVVSSILTAGLSTSLMAEPVRQHDAHEHGVSQLKIAIDKNKFLMELEAPGADIVGFEHKAENADQQKSIEQALALLGAPGKLFDLPLSAGCLLSSASSEFMFHNDEDEHPEGEAEHEEHEEDEGHAEFHASYLFICSSPGALKTMGIKFFDRFPNAEEIELEAISDFGQLAVEIPKGTRQIDLSTIVQ
ncbi:MAG: DUF2796 domain-containing protein [Cohaesibacteraceae bacterium]|nr:DUF2796 domain-containing protein [Cohaesibacteraceae bacterium]